MTNWRRPPPAVVMALTLAAAGCAPDPPPTAPRAGFEVARLPVAISNNAVAAVDFGEHFKLYSFLGLLPGKTWRETTDRAFEYDSRTGAWTELPPVPGGVGRLAGSAQTVAGQVYLFGGYTVAEDGSEASTPQVHRFDPDTGSYRELPPMPVPVDDTVTGVYRDRYVYLVSGWHDTDNVANVQILDTETESWLQATPYPGPPLFGHAGGLAGATLIVCDGVTVVPPAHPGGRRGFEISSLCYRGDIDPADLTRIDWRPLPAHPGRPTYRAAAGTSRHEPARVIFAGGTDNPFNYSGIGYDGEPAVPSRAVFSYDPTTDRWLEHPPLAAASMDHRGLAIVGDHGFLIGGMDGDQAPTAAVVSFLLP